MSVIKIRVELNDNDSVNADIIGPLTTAVSQAVVDVIEEMYGRVERPQVAVTINEPDPEPEEEAEVEESLPKVLPRRE